MNRNILYHIKRWLGEHSEHCSFAIICAVGLSGLLLMIFNHWGPHKTGVDNSSLYLLSSIVQGLAAILALLVTVSVVGSQLAATTYTPRFLRQRLKDFWLWSAVSIYLVAIIWSLIVLSTLGNLSLFVARDWINIALFLAVIALTYIIPFTIATFKNLQPDQVAKWLVENDELTFLAEFMRKAVSTDTMLLLETTLNLFTKRTRINLNNANGAEQQAQQPAVVLFSVGKHACQCHNTDALKMAMEQLTELVSYCNEPPRNWRAAADIFNDTVRELYFTSESLLEREQKV